MTTRMVFHQRTPRDIFDHPEQQLVGRTRLDAVDPTGDVRHAAERMEKVVQARIDEVVIGMTDITLEPPGPNQFILNRGSIVGHSPPCCRNILEASVDLQTETATETDHFIGAGGWTSDAKHGITLFEKSNGDGMEDLIEGVVANTARSGKFNQRESQPLTKNRDVSGSEERQRVRLHFIDVFQDQSRIVIRAGTVGTCDQNHQGIA
jgi:hypothetical protein